MKSIMILQLKSDLKKKNTFDFCLFDVSVTFILNVKIFKYVKNTLTEKDIPYRIKMRLNV